jgi:predicted adenine nucleotide alpha hydrolase (AANH) superfamily ATPase
MILFNKINSFEKVNFMDKKILLNACCAPDATHSIDVLRNLGFTIITYFYNPNIHPKEEYLKRLQDMEKLTKILQIENIENVPYDVEEWHTLCDKYKDEKEGGKRCEICYEMRLRKTGQKAKELNINIFATTLTISPHKNAKLINEIGKKIATEFNIEYLETDFKKKDGFKKSIELSKKYGLYRQNYCGCVYSLPKNNKKENNQ